MIEEPACVRLGHAGRLPPCARSRSCSSRTAARSRCACSGRAASSGSGRSPSSRPTTRPRSMRARPTRSSRSRLPQFGGAHPRSEAERRGRDPSRLRLPRARTPTSPMRSTPPGSPGSGRRRRHCVSAGTSSRRSGSRARPASRSCPTDRRRRSASRSLVKAAAAAAGAGCASFARRPSSRTRSRRPSARRPARSATGRSTASATSSAHATSRCSCSPTSTEPSWRSASATAPSSGATRRCSRRRPLPASPPALRAALHEAAVAFGRAIGYRSAGTVEFVLDGDDFHFLELNGRIQVEHPVTEAVTGVDLVAEQLRIAAGDPSTPSVRDSGHAVEVRLYAEDPRTFLPQTGRLEAARAPSDTDKLGSRRRWGRGGRRGRSRLRPDDREADRPRADARRRARRARGRAAETRIEGVTTNLPFLRWLVDHPVVTSREATTAFLTEHPPLSSPPSSRACRLPDSLATQPPLPAARATAGHRRRVAPAGPGARGEQGDRTDAGHGDPPRGRSRRHRARAPAARRPRGDEDGDPGALAVRGHGQGRARRGGRPDRGWDAPGRAGQG